MPMASPRRLRVAQLQGPAPGMLHDLARLAMQPPAKGLDAHRLAACVQHAAHQREQVERDHAQRGMQRVGSEVAARRMGGAEAAAKLADAVLRILAPAAASADRLRVAPPAEAARQGPAGEAALRQGVGGLRAVELELLPAGFSHPPHHRREGFRRAFHRVREARRLLRLVQPPDLPGHARIEPGANRVVDAPAREMADDPRPAARRVDAGATRLGALGQGALALADELAVARVRRGRAAPKLRTRRHAGLGDVADDRHAAPLLLACGLRRRLLAAPRSHRCPGPPSCGDAARPPAAAGRPASGRGTRAAPRRGAAATGPRHRRPTAGGCRASEQRHLLAKLRRCARMPRALVHHHHERGQLRPRAEAAVAARTRHQPLEMGVEPQLAHRLGQRRQAASRSRFVFRGGNLAGLDTHKALLRSGPPSG